MSHISVTLPIKAGDDINDAAIMAVGLKNILGRDVKVRLTFNRIGITVRINDSPDDIVSRYHDAVKTISDGVIKPKIKIYR